MRQYGRLFLSFSFFFALFVGVVFSSPSSVSSQGATVKREDVGPEVAGAGYTEGEQQDLNNALLLPQNYTGIVQFANGVGQKAYNPTPQLKKVVIRLVGFDFSTPTSEFEKYGTSLCENKALFPDSSQAGQSTILLVGNELNNLDLEYTGTTDLGAAGKQYAAQFNAVAEVVKAGCGSHFRIAPASPDLYNAVWNPVPWLAAVVNGVSCSNIDVLVANIFEVTPRPETGHTDWKGVYKYVEEKVGAKCSGKKVVHFGGFGPNPNTQPPPSIQSQLDWFASDKASLPSGVETATTLLLDPCKNSNVSKSDWLFYVYGKAYNAEGAEVLDNCSTKKKSVFVYPGIDDQANVENKRKMAARYMYTCGSVTGLSMEALNENQLSRQSSENYTSYLDTNGLDPGGVTVRCPEDEGFCIIKPLTATVYMNNQKTTIPLIRFEPAQVPNPDSKSRRRNDLEGFFGALYTNQKVEKDSDKFIAPLANGVTQKLFGQEDQCENKIRFLQSINTLCTMPRHPMTPINSDTLPPPEEGVCALDEDIPGVGKSYLQVLREIPANFSCSSDTVKMPAKTAEAFSKIETSTHKGFKPAYIVRYLDTPARTDPNAPPPFSSVKNWFPPGGEVDKGDSSKDDNALKERIKLTKVYVPAGFAEATGTRKPSGDTSLDFPTYTSPFMGTNLSVFDYEEQKQIEEAKEIEINKVYERSKADSAKDPNPGSPRFISCNECKGPNEDNLESLVARRINAEIFPNLVSGDARFGTQLCDTVDDLTGEKADIIKQSVNPPGNPDPVTGQLSIGVAGGVHIKAGAAGEDAHIRTFFLLPEEYRNIQLYEEKFVERFIPEELQGKFLFAYTRAGEVRLRERNTIVGYRFLQLSDSQPDAPPGAKDGSGGPTVYISSPENAGAAVGNDRDPSKPEEPDPVCNDPLNESPACKRLKGVITGPDLSNFDNNPQVPGGKLAASLWHVLCNVARPYDGFETAQYPGFEKFLKEGYKACQGKAIQTPTSPPPIAAGSCNYGDAAVNAAIENAAAKYSVPSEMLLAIYQSEGWFYRLDPENWVCEENGATAAGVMQITKGTYGIVTCPDERMEDDLASCQATQGKLSRCDVNTAFELAARVLLQKVGHWIYGVCDGRQRNTAALSRENIREVYRAAGFYYGLCTPDTLTVNFSTGALNREHIISCRGGDGTDCRDMGYADFVCAFMAKKNGLDYCNRPDNFPPRSFCDL
jgi:hypothetical protein